MKNMGLTAEKAMEVEIYCNEITPAQSCYFGRELF